MEEVLGAPEQAPGEVPSPEEPDKEPAASESCEAEKKGDENPSDTRPLCSPEERRHLQRERLNQILLNLLEKIPGKNGESSGSACTAPGSAAGLGSLG